MIVTAVWQCLAILVVMALIAWSAKRGGSDPV